jgi:hypothetical protein
MPRPPRSAAGQQAGGAAGVGGGSRELDFYPRDSRGGQEAVVRSLAPQAVSGSLTPRELAAAIHQHFGHSLPLAERLAALDDEYDLGAYATMTREQIDQEVITDAVGSHEQADQRTAPNDQ